MILGFPDHSRPEVRLLLKCVRRNLSTDRLTEIRQLLESDLDWNFLLTEAKRHGVLPLLNRGLHPNFQQYVPAGALECLRTSCRLAQQRNLALTSALLRILALFESAGIAASPFKGPMLAVIAYGDLSLRTFGDLDILLHEPDLRRSQNILAAEGYVPAYSLTAGQERAYRKAECALQLQHPAHDVTVELHWLLTERYLSIDLPVEQIWSRLQPATLAGRGVRAFAPEDLLLYLCIHAGKHRWERLEWLCSIAELVASRRELDWSEIQERARQAGVQRFLHASLVLASGLLEMDMPEAIRGEVLSDRGAQVLAQRIASTLFHPEGDTSPLTDRGGWYLHLLRSRERWRDRAKIVLFSWVRLPHPSSEELIQLPAPLWFLYYVFRPARLLVASLHAAWRYCVSQRKTPSEPICTR